MTVKELIGQLMDMPMDATVDVQIDPGADADDCQPGAELNVQAVSQSGAGRYCTLRVA